MRHDLFFGGTYSGDFLSVLRLVWNIVFEDKHFVEETALGEQLFGGNLLGRQWATTIQLFFGTFLVKSIFEVENNFR